MWAENIIDSMWLKNKQKTKQKNQLWKKINKVSKTYFRKDSCLTGNFPPNCPGVGNSDTI